MSTPAAEPGKGLGIAGLVFAFLIPILGVILSAVARSQSAKAGIKNTPATVGLVLGIIFTVLGIIVFATTGAGILAALNAAQGM